MSVGPRAEKFNIVSNEKFNIVSNDHGRTHKCFFPFSTGNTLFAKICSKKKKKVCQCNLKFGTKTNSNMLNCDVHFFCFSLEISFLGKLGPKTQNRQIKVKFGS